MSVEVSDFMLTEQVKVFGKKRNISDFSYPHGWLMRFKKRHGIRSFNLQGESGGANMEIVAGLEKLFPL